MNCSCLKSGFSYQHILDNIAERFMASLDVYFPFERRVDRLKMIRSSLLTVSACVRNLTQVAQTDKLQLSIQSLCGISSQFWECTYQLLFQHLILWNKSTLQCHQLLGATYFLSTKEQIYWIRINEDALTYEMQIVSEKEFFWVLTQTLCSA